MKINFIVNETSGAGSCKSHWKDLEGRLQGVDYVVWRTGGRGDATSIARQLTENMEEDTNLCVVAVGGDGTINEVLNGLQHRERICFGVIPLGSGNDFCGGLGLSVDPAEQLQRILGFVSDWEVCHGAIPDKRIDLGLVEYVSAGQDTYFGKDDGMVAEKHSRLFGISCGYGMDALVCKKVNQSKMKTLLNRLHMGKLVYILITVMTLFTMKTANIKLFFSHPLIGKHPDRDFFPLFRDANAEIYCSKVIFAAGMNLFAEGGGVPMAPAASVHDGKISLVIAYGIPKWRTFFCLPLLMAAKHEKLKGFDVIHAASVSLQADMAQALHADGEYCGDVREMTIKALPDAITLMNL